MLTASQVITSKSLGKAMNRSKTITLLLISLITLAPSLSYSITFSVLPDSTYLRAPLIDPTSAPTIIDLASLGLSAGDTVRLTQLGDIAVGPNFPNNVDDKRVMGAVFSSSNILLGQEILNRVSGAIDAGIDLVTPNHFSDGLSTDIAEDFAIPVLGFLDIMVPDNAQYLFVGVRDVFYSDNFDADGDYGIDIAAIPIPATFSLFLSGFLGLIGISRLKNGLTNRSSQGFQAAVFMFAVCLFMRQLKHTP